jgi:hypothetical protein
MFFFFEHMSSWCNDIEDASHITYHMTSGLQRVQSDTKPTLSTTSIQITFH